MRQFGKSLGSLLALDLDIKRIVRTNYLEGFDSVCVGMYSEPPGLDNRPRFPGSDDGTCEENQICAKA